MRPSHASPQSHPRKNVPDTEVTESQFFNDPDVIDEAKLLNKETPHRTPTVVSSNTEESDHENPQEIIMHFKPERIPSPAIANLYT